MDKQIFKVGDKVYDAMCGWGEVKDIDEHLVFIKFYKDNYLEYNYLEEYNHDGRFSESDINPRLSFTEYGFDNRFSQERPINYNDYIGKWGKFWHDCSKEYTISKLEKVKLNKFKSNTSIALYDNFEPLTEEQIKILNL